MKQLAARVLSVALSLLVSLTVMAEEANDPKVGIGLGIPYGVLGVNGEIPLTPMFSVSTGVGVGFEKPAFTVGFHLNAPTNSSVTPRLSLYGSTAVAAMEVCEISFFSSGNCEIEQFAGTAFGAGIVATHFHMEFLVVNSPAFDERKDELEDQGARFEEENTIALVLAYRF